MEGTTPQFPVLARESALPSTLDTIEDAESLLMIIEEFADIIDEFEAWDSASKRVDLATPAHMMLAGKPRPQVLVANDPSEGEIWAALRAYCDAMCIENQRQPGESPLAFFRRVQPDK